MNSTRSMSGRITLTEKDIGRTVPVSARAVVELSRPKSPTAGLRWSAPGLAGVALVAGTYVTQDPGAPGAAARRVLCLKLSPGGHHLELACAQAWAPAVESDRFDLVLQSA